MISEFQIDERKISIIDMGVRLPSSEELKISGEIIGGRKKIKVMLVGMSFKRKGGYVLIRAAEEVKKAAGQSIL